MASLADVTPAVAGGSDAVVLPPPSHTDGTASVDNFGIMVRRWLSTAPSNTVPAAPMPIPPMSAAEATRGCCSLCSPNLSPCGWADGRAPSSSLPHSHRPLHRYSSSGGGGEGEGGGGGLPSTTCGGVDQHDSPHHYHCHPSTSLNDSSFGVSSAFGTLAPCDSSSSSNHFHFRGPIVPSQFASPSAVTPPPPLHAAVMHNTDKYTHSNSTLGTPPTPTAATSRMGYSFSSPAPPPPPLPFNRFAVAVVDGPSSYMNCSLLGGDDDGDGDGGAEKGEKEEEEDYSGGVVVSIVPVPMEGGRLPSPSSQPVTLQRSSVVVASANTRDDDGADGNATSASSVVCLPSVQQPIWAPAGSISPSSSDDGNNYRHKLRVFPNTYRIASDGDGDGGGDEEDCLAVGSTTASLGRASTTPSPTALSDDDDDASHGCATLVGCSTSTSSSSSTCSSSSSSSSPSASSLSSPSSSATSLRRVVWEQGSMAPPLIGLHHCSAVTMMGGGAGEGGGPAAMPTNCGGHVSQAATHSHHHVRHFYHRDDASDTADAQTVETTQSRQQQQCPHPLLLFTADADRMRLTAGARCFEGAPPPCPLDPHPHPHPYPPLLISDGSFGLHRCHRHQKQQQQGCCQSSYGQRQHAWRAHEEEGQCHIYSHGHSHGSRHWDATRREPQVDHRNNHHHQLRHQQQGFRYLRDGDVSRGGGDALLSNPSPHDGHQLDAVALPASSTMDSRSNSDRRGITVTDHLGGAAGRSSINKYTLPRRAASASASRSGPTRFIEIPTDDELRAFLKQSLGSAYPTPKKGEGKGLGAQPKLPPRGEIECLNHSD